MHSLGCLFSVKYLTLQWVEEDDAANKAKEIILTLHFSW